MINPIKIVECLDTIHVLHEDGSKASRCLSAIRNNIKSCSVYEHESLRVQGGIEGLEVLNNNLVTANRWFNYEDRTFSAQRINMTLAITACMHDCDIKYDLINEVEALRSVKAVNSFALKLETMFVAMHLYNLEYSEEATEKASLLTFDNIGLSTSDILKRIARGDIVPLDERQARNFKEIAERKIRQKDSSLDWVVVLDYSNDVLEG